MGFARVPAELQMEIFGFLDRPGIKSCRGVCRSFRDNASPCLFGRVLACPRYQALGALQKISLHSVYPRYVKEIVYDGSVYDSCLATNENRYHQSAEEEPEIRQGFPWEKRRRFKRYQNLYQDQEDMRTGGVLLQTIARALEWMPNVTSVVYSPGPHTVPVEARLMKDLLPRGVSDTSMFQGDSLSSYIERAQHGIHHLIGAIYASQYPGIRSFRVEAAERGKRNVGTEFTHYVFNFPSSNHLDAGKFFFRHLHKVVMNLSLLIPQRIARDPTDQMEEAMIHTLAALLVEAKELTELSFRLCHWRKDANQMFGHVIFDEELLFPSLGLRHTWPRLRKLSLGGIYASGKEMTHLIIRHKTTLNMLQFDHCSLISGAWADIVDEVVFNTNIIAFSLHLVNETDIGDTRFQDMASEEMEQWQYQGKLRIDSEGRRYFDEPDYKSVYAKRGVI
ncbi:uncharacterized protein BDR25DRAFT_333557 [Lindgomyces ingoldianus]|uniref:Uncharacterized protein n=1 Tax=Lindgomyces ingoldianus TaxID=673940 RepID=A0ACB6R0V8_9PLEO|nr:uncharacterized protein BDR25DRAFT_333557 [Lindgomyces ingoldianus]KAF2472152.1 hypothetical protein BDR25DRAFT_333557 [Lindgomyces ingoldianus]